MEKWDQISYRPNDHFGRPQVTQGAKFKEGEGQIKRMRQSGCHLATESTGWWLLLVHEGISGGLLPPLFCIQGLTARGPGFEPQYTRPVRYSASRTRAHRFCWSHHIVSLIPFIPSLKLCADIKPKCWSQLRAPLQRVFEWNFVHLIADFMILGLSTTWNSRLQMF